jgi:hypothetical protein
MYRSDSCGTPRGNLSREAAFRKTEDDPRSCVADVLPIVLLLRDFPHLTGYILSRKICVRIVISAKKREAIGCAPYRCAEALLHEEVIRTNA